MNQKSVFASFTAGIFMLMVFSMAGFAGAATQKGKVIAVKTSTLTCSLTERGSTPAKIPALVKWTQNREGSMTGVSVSIKSGRVVLAEMTDGQIAWRPSATQRLQMQKYKTEPGLQTCSIIQSVMSPEKGISVVGSCSILPESGMPAETTARFDLRIPAPKNQNSGYANVGNRFYVAGYALTNCK